MATPTPSSGPVSDSGWLTSSASIDHGRFGPGTILDNRYRVLGLLGRGGMGEVYKADDLRLGQQVALKFLPASLSRDPARLAQFHNEVRTARQVSHANVCRVYDIGEIEGQLFITMEYVDGEDLSILLRRIGRLPEDKGIEIARQICAGLAAAHERGVLHRDLKPANIMLDGAGKVRIMDFSLAAVGDVADVRAGTPAYMAPEQLAGQEVTVRSDIYALGLVLYEIFTGRRAYDAKNLNELLEQHRSGTLTSPTTIVKTLDAAIETAIVRCLDPHAARRPPSAISVSAALPGGDPLAAALAAGETPSPEMVAAAGGDEATLSGTAGVLWMAVCGIAVIAAAVLAARTSLLSRVPLTKPAEVLADRAEAIRESLGYTDAPVDRSSYFVYDDAYLSWGADQESARKGWPELATGRPAAVRFWYRTSPRPMIPVSALNSVGPSDPPVIVNGMTLAVVDTNGRLLQFEAAPPQVEAPPPATPPSVDWQKLFAAAGLDISAFTEVASTRTPQAYADARKAWTGTLPGTEIPVTIVAAGYRGRPILFDMVTPWSRPSREPQTRPPVNSSWLLVWFVLAGASLAAWGNARRGRADLRGAFRVAAFMVVVLAAGWAAGPHVASAPDEQQRFFARTGLALFVGGAMYIVYLGLEPFVRRLWPSILVGWSRVLSGRLRDPMIGRDALIGIACGGTLAILDLASLVLPPLLKLPWPAPHVTDFGPLTGVRGALLTLVQSVNTGMQNALLSVFEYSSLRMIFEWVTRTPIGSSRWTIASKVRMTDRASEKIFVLLCVGFMSYLAVGTSGTPMQRSLPAVVQAASTLLVLVVMLRAGIFAVTMMFFTYMLLLRMPMTFDASSLFVSGAWFVIALLLGVAVAGFRLATRQSTRSTRGQIS